VRFVAKNETVDNPIKFAGEYYDDELDMNKISKEL